MKETLHKRERGKNTSKEIVNENYCSTVKNQLSGIANSSKNLLLRHIFDPKVRVFSSSDRLQTSINR